MRTSVFALWLFSQSALAQHFDLRAPGFVPRIGSWGNMYAFVAADFDGDGDQDIVGKSDAIVMLTNEGNGRFRHAFDLPQVQIERFLVADFDGDGDPDVLCVTPNTLTMLVNSVTAFTAVHVFQFPVPDYGNAVAVADVDNDGDIDIVSANYGWSSAMPLQIVPHPGYLLRNNGAGAFIHDPIALPSASEPYSSLAAADFDGDGDIDLVQGGYNLRVLTNDSTGNFGAHSPPVAAVGAVYDLTAFDADGDSDVDVACATGAGEQLFVNDGTGRLTSSITLPPSGRSNHVLGGDVDGDGDTDLLVTAVGPPVVSFEAPPRLWRNDGAGGFQLAQQPWSQLELAALRPLMFDADGDSDLDVLLFDQPRERLFWNDGSGSFVELDDPGVAWYQGWPKYFVDLDGDGHLDVVAVRETFASPRQWHLRWWQNDGTGALRPRGEILPPRDDEIGDIEFFDADGDSDLDAYVSTSQPFQDRLVRNDGTTFVKIVPGFPNDWVAATVESGDIDNDGDTDVVVGDIYAVRVLVATAPFTFIDETSTRTPPVYFGVSVVLRDFDGDNDLDIACAGQDLRLLSNDGTGHFADTSTTQLPPLPTPIWGCGSLDADADSDQDLVAWGNSGLFLLRNDSGTFVDVTATNVVPPATQVWSLTVGDVDSDGDPDLFVGTLGEVFWYRNDGTGVFVRDPAVLFPASHGAPLALADIDYDGDVDALMLTCLFRGTERHLEHALPPRIGRHGELRILARPAGSPRLASLLLAPSRAPQPIPLGPIGTLLLDPGSAWVRSTSLVPPSGELLIGYQVPAAPALLGARLWAQALIADSPAVTDWRLSNLVELSVLL